MMFECRLFYMGKRAIILFGAGASNGCGGIEKPPPIGKDLFECLAEDFQETWGAIPEQYVERFEDFEDGMGALYNNNPDVFDILKDMTVYFSRFSIEKPQENLYCDLVSRYRWQLLSQELIFSTINYDCLLEHAVLSINQSDPISYVGEGPGMRIYKIHGSCNFIPRGISGEGNWTHTGGIIDAGLDYIHPFRVEERMAKMPVPAAMSLYVKSKKILISSKIIESMINEFQYQVLESDLAIVIGVRPNVDDKHIWDYLSKMEGNLALVGNEDKCKDWLAKYRNNEGDEWLGNRFDSSFDEVVSMADEYFR